MMRCHASREAHVGLCALLVRHLPIEARVQATQSQVTPIQSQSNRAVVCEHRTLQCPFPSGSRPVHQARAAVRENAPGASPVPLLGLSLSPQNKERREAEWKASEMCCGKGKNRGEEREVQGKPSCASEQATCCAVSHGGTSSVVDSRLAGAPASSPADALLFGRTFLSSCIIFFLYL